MTPEQIKQSLLSMPIGLRQLTLGPFFPDTISGSLDVSDPEIPGLVDSIVSEGRAGQLGYECRMSEILSSLLN